ncbi:amidohydrolase family protein [Rhizobium sp. S152]|uniref:amidohydrolase family protein n=1 Tax=Rhizobium sp. S152 TaxID=3055038 RepID=UPI0025A94695|nr:amidohydrolase family protein [Rhizobium sp. S152]MDM9627875.1 amidohydrolase family protein [Rhizobium sp. S152]
MDCIIEAGVVFCGLNADGTPSLRHDAAIRIHNGRIAHIGAVEAVVAGNAHLPRHGGAGFVAMPGLVNGHHHFGLTPLMMGVPFAPLELWLPQFRGMRSIGPRLDTLYSAIEMLESGTTTVHHIASGLTGDPENWRAATDEVLGAYQQIGMRAGYSFMMRDRNILTYENDAEVLKSLPADLAEIVAAGLKPAQVPTRDYMTFFRETRERWTGTGRGRLRFNLAPANLHWCSDESLQLIFETARTHGAQVHMHLLETRRQAEFAQARYGHSAVEHLAALECLGPELTLGHGNWMTRRDLDLVADCGCSICHNASSGLRLGSGIAPVNEMRRRNIPVALGIDQSNVADDRDMLLEMKLVWALHRETGMWNDRPDAGAVLRMATEHGARTAGFGETVGRLEPGFAGDVVLLDRTRLERPFVDRRVPISETILHRGSRSAVDKVFIDGEMVVENGRVCRIDRDTVLDEIAARLKAPETAPERQARMTVETLMPYLEAFHQRHTPPDASASYRFNAMND